MVILGSYHMLRLRLTHNWADVGKCTCGSGRGAVRRRRCLALRRRQLSPLRCR